MNTDEKIKYLEVAAEIQQGIGYFEAQIKNKKTSIRIMAGNFPDLEAKYLNDIDTYERCIVRLQQRYTTALERCKI